MNIVNNEIIKLLPYFKGLAYDTETNFIRLSIEIPNHWVVTEEFKTLIISIFEGDENNNLYIIGKYTGLTYEEVKPLELIPVSIKDEPIDYFLNEIKKLIDFNLEEEKKQQLIQNKMEELQKYFATASLEELQKFNSPIKPELTNAIDNEVINNKKTTKNKNISK